MISEANSTSTPVTSGDADANNFITINTNLSDAHIILYTDDAGTTGAINGVDENSNTVNGIALSAAEVSTGTYKIRLPKNARSFKITGKNGNTDVTSAVQKLYDNVTVTSTGDSITMSNFHHAGTTFSYSGTNNAALTVTSLRSGYTLSKSDMTDPLSPRSDSDYVFFTDTNNSFASGNKVYAYYYGAEDGEYTAWPGIEASATSAAPTTYTDNNNNKVYMFRVPKNDEGKYSKVIFTDGVTTTARKITAAADLEAGKNYVLGAATTAAYDTVFAPSNHVYEVTAKTKADGVTKNYTTSKNRYIYIVNNGTQNLTGDTVENSRFGLDEMHVVFYDHNNNAVGTNPAGYLPDKLGTYTGSTWEATQRDGHDVYRIQVQENAKYFRINNGINKGLDKNDEDTHLNERYSEIKEIADNGLYRFVEGKSTAADYLADGSTSPSTADDRYKPKYLLELLNPFTSGEETRPITIRDVWLAAIETDDTVGNEGKVKYIKDLKAEGVDGGVVANTTLNVDRAYLDHTRNDIEDTSVKKVNVLEKGTYYWKERSAPSGYKLNTDIFEFVYDDDGKVYFRNEEGFLEEVTGADPTVVIKNEEEDTPKGEVILTKTAKEKVGTTDIGDILAGAQFRIVNADDPTAEIKLKKTNPDPDGAVAGKKTHEYVVDNGGTYNTGTTYPETGDDGRLHIKGLPVGSYYLEEQAAPNGYSEIDSNTGAKRRVYFSVGENREVKEISASDEMAPAYIKLYEHISEKRSEWGNPTFVFRIKQTGYYKNDGTTDIQTIENGKEILVALTVDDDNNITNVVKWFNPNGINFDEDKINNTTYGDWLVEGTTDLTDYQGIFNIDSKGRIRVEPGSYEITRLPVSRYKFVTNGKNEPYDNDTELQPWTAYTDPDTNAASEKLKIAELPAGKTIDVHYYDTVDYYDKFTQVDENINKFYTLDGSKKNTTVKGIRIADYKQNDISDTDANDVMTVNVSSLDIYKIMSDGSEAAMTQAEKDALTNFNITYTYVEGDKQEFGGATLPAAIPAQFSYNSTTKQITVNDASTFAKGVYTLDASYNGWNAKFDIIFARS